MDLNFGLTSIGTWCIKCNNDLSYYNLSHCRIFGRPFVKRFRPILSDLCLSVLSLCPVCLSVCLSVCDVGVLWPNGWMDQDETCMQVQPRPGPQCVRWRPSSPSPKGAQPPNFRPMSIVVKRSPISATGEHLLHYVVQNSDSSIKIAFASCVVSN